jgi:hypothetical protein
VTGGCTAYRDLNNSRNKDNPKRINNTPQQDTNYVHQNISYSQAASDRPATHQTNSSPTDIANQLTMFLSEFDLFHSGPSHYQFTKLFILPSSVTYTFHYFTT